MQITQALRGYELAPYRWTWGPDDVILYALGVGAEPPRDLGFIYEGEAGPDVLPTFASLSTGRTFLSMVHELGIPLEAVLHGDHTLTLHGRFPVSASVTVERRIAEVWDKGRDAVIVIEDRVVSERLLAESRSSWFVKGAGGFGGERGPSSSAVRADPTRPPDVVRRVVVAPARSALYRLSGDRNPIHIDPAFARRAGFGQIFIHGLCTFGMVGLEVLAEMCDGRADQLRELETRFISPVRPGDALEIALWREGPELVRAQASVDGRPVLAGARATTAAHRTSQSG